MKRLFYIIFFMVAVMACKEVFDPPPQALLQATFYNSSTSLAISPSVTLVGVGVDELLYSDTTLNSVYMPLTLKDTTCFVIWLDSKSDSIILTHESIQKLASMESGFYYEYVLKSARCTNNRIDSVEIVESLVTTEWNENIKLYIHPLSDSGD